MDFSQRLPRGISGRLDTKEDRRQWLASLHISPYAYTPPSDCLAGQDANRTQLKAQEQARQGPSSDRYHSHPAPPHRVKSLFLIAMFKCRPLQKGEGALLQSPTRTTPAPRSNDDGSTPLNCTCQRTWVLKMGRFSNSMRTPSRLKRVTVSTHPLLLHIHTSQ